MPEGSLAGRHRSCSHPFRRWAALLGGQRLYSARPAEPRESLVLVSQQQQTNFMFISADAGGGRPSCAVHPDQALLPLRVNGLYTSDPAMASPLA